MLAHPRHCHSQLEGLRHVAHPTPPVATSERTVSRIQGWGTCGGQQNGQAVDSEQLRSKALDLDREELWVPKACFDQLGLCEFLEAAAWKLTLWETI